VILGIDHVGVVTEDPDGVGAFLDALGMRRTEDGTAPGYGVSCDFWQFSPAPAEPAVEVVAPVEPDAAVHDYLAKNGPGLYHVAFEVDDLTAELSRLRRNGFVPIDREPCRGARPGMSVAFLYLPKPAAFLVELVAYPTPRRPTPTDHPR
jgi:methylmalonyl-CoA/ethylmalonyl-CoA epimerase